VPLNLSNRDQNSGHLFYNRRLKAAITRFSVRMKHDDRKQQAALALSMVFVLIGCAWMALLHFMKPAGIVGESNIVGNRQTGAIYAKIDGRLYPALNLTSARLATGSPNEPTWVKAEQIAKFPTGPMIGIPGIPDDLPASGGMSVWTVCDTAAAKGTAGAPVVTSIAGRLDGGGRSAPLGPDQAVLATHGDGTYVIWGGQRTRIDPADRSVTFTLGLDPGKTAPIEISNALFDSMPATEPLVVPVIPEAGAPSRWLPGTPVGTVLETRDANGTVSGFYALLPDGVQKISGFVADLLRTANAQGMVAPQLVFPDRLVDIPVVDALNVGYYPVNKLNFVDTEADPVTCVTWEKLYTDRQASISVLTGRGLPVSPAMDSHLVTLVRDDRDPDSVQANRTLVLPGAANFVATTSGVSTSDTRESLFWISPQGVRYGIEWDTATLSALAIDAGRAVQAPWPMVRTFAAGPSISRSAALVARDTITTDAAVAAIPGADQQESGG
jgi:type VII secretion protein EccB